MHSNDFTVLLDEIIPLLDELFRVYEIKELKLYKMIKLIIPWERSNSYWERVDLLDTFYHKKLIYDYKIKGENLGDVFSYMVFRNEEKMAKNL